AAVDAAVRSGDSHAVTARLRSVLCELIRDPAVRLPDCVHDRIDDHYARREVYRSPDLGYSVIAMTWGPGQGTPIHDHCGRWCVGARARPPRCASAVCCACCSASPPCACPTACTTGSTTTTPAAGSTAARTSATAWSP